MKKLLARFGKLIVISFFIMALGLILFLLTPLLYSQFNLDTDIVGVIIFFGGLALWILGIIRRSKPQGWKLVLLIVLLVLLCQPLLMLLFTSVYYLITGHAVGS